MPFVSVDTNAQSPLLGFERHRFEAWALSVRSIEEPEIILDFTFFG